MGWETSNRREDLPSNWKAIRLKVLKRDSYRCQGRFSDGKPCDRKAEEVDHIGDKRNHSLSNLRSLCSWHHGKRTSAQGHAANAKLKKMNSQRFRRDEDHPLDLFLRRSKG